MNPATFNAFANGSDIDLDMIFYTLEDAIDVVEFQESLNYEDLELPDMEEM